MNILLGLAFGSASFALEPCGTRSDVLTVVAVARVVLRKFLLEETSWDPIEKDALGFSTTRFKKIKSNSFLGNWNLFMVVSFGEI